jgi:hypothetical protein
MLGTAGTHRSAANLWSEYFGVENKKSGKPTSELEVGSDIVTSISV